jgi:iron complex outermembrane receptor protein
MDKKFAAVAATAALCLNSAEAFAEDTGELEEVVVTAQRRSENLQDVPVAVSVVTGDALRDSAVRSLQDLAGSVPGLVTTNSVNYGSAPLSIRGIGGANGGGNVFADEPVAVYVDDAYVSRLRLSTADLVDIQGIEVLRGPQGTLYGRNSTAGALLLHSAEPTVERTARFSGSLGSYSDMRGQGAVSGALNDSGTLIGRLALGASSSDGWGNNSVGGHDLNRGHDAQGRAFLRFKPATGLKIDLIADFSKSYVVPGTIAVSDMSNLRDAVTNPTGTNVVTPYVLRPGLQGLVDNNQYALNYPTYTAIEGRNYTGRVEWQLGSTTLTAISNYRTWHLNGSQDSDGTAIQPPNRIFVTGALGDIGDNRNGNSRDRQYSQELRLASADDARLGWLVGAYYFNEYNSVNPISISNYLAGPGGAGTLVTFVANQQNRSLAAFGNLGWRISDALRLSAGLRYGSEHKDFFDHQLVQTINQFDPPGPTIFTAGQVLAAPPDLNLSRTDHNVSPRVVLDWKPRQGLLTYLSFSKGFKSGGFNVFRGVSPSFAPETVTAWEAGLKSDISKSLRVNLSAFHYDYHDLQVRTPVASGGVGIESAAAARSQGLEAEVSATATRHLRFDANFAWLDAKFTSGTLTAIQQQSWVFGTNPGTVSEDISGHHLSRAPGFQGALSGTLQWAAGAQTASFQASVRHQGKVYFLETQQQAPTYQGSAWTELDARFALAGEGDRWSLALYGRNLLNDRHFSQITAFFGLPNGALNDPRRVGLQLTASR